MVKRLIIPLLAVLLLLAASCRQARPPFLPPPEVLPPPEMNWEVRTDYSGLTPYAPPHIKHTRLRDGPLAMLIPSDNYGLLLPYASAGTMPDGSLRALKYGLVTMDGMVVTDLVFSSVERAEHRNYYHSTEMLPPLPAYSLAIDVSGLDTPWRADSWRGACALDGSWITPFEYREVVFTEDAILLMRGHQTFDIDIYDYNGQFMYNVLDSQWASNIAPDTWPGYLTYYVSEGIACLPDHNGNYFFIEMLTGRTMHTSFRGAAPFAEGLAAVCEMSVDSWEHIELWGFIDRDFNLVIPPRYTQPASFINGRATVETPGGETHVIDKRGNTLYVTPRGYRLEEDYTGFGYTAHRIAGEDSPIFYTEDFAEIFIPEIARSAGYIYVNRHGVGWYSCSAENGTILFARGKEYFFREIQDIAYMDGTYMIYFTYGNTTPLRQTSHGVRTLGGKEIIVPEAGVSISPVVENGLAKAFVVNTQGAYIYFGGNEADYRPSAYRLVGTDGEVIVSGYGALSYDGAAGLYKVLGRDFFAWLDMDGNTIISIPHMSYIMD